MVVGPSATPVEWRGVSVKVLRRPPTFGNARSSRRHRHLGRAAGDERGKDHTNRSSHPIADAAREHEPGGPPDALGSGASAGAGLPPPAGNRTLPVSRRTPRRPSRRSWSIVPTRTATCSWSMSLFLSPKGQTRRLQRRALSHLCSPCSRLSRSLSGPPSHVSSPFPYPYRVIG